MPGGIDLPMPHWEAKQKISAAKLNQMSSAISGISNARRGSGIHSIQVGGMTFEITSSNQTDDEEQLIYKNISGHTVPPYGIIDMVDFSGKILAKRPSTFGSQRLAFINNSQSVDDDNTGVCINPGDGTQHTAAYEPGDGVPQFGEVWGPLNGSFLLRKNVGGFRIVGEADADGHLVSVIQEPLLHLEVELIDTLQEEPAGLFSPGPLPYGNSGANGYVLYRDDSGNPQRYTPSFTIPVVSASFSGIAYGTTDKGDYGDSIMCNAMLCPPLTQGAPTVVWAPCSGGRQTIWGEAVAASGLPPVTDNETGETIDLWDVNLKFAGGTHTLAIVALTPLGPPTAGNTVYLTWRKGYWVISGEKCPS